MRRVAGSKRISRRSGKKRFETTKATAKQKQKHPEMNDGEVDGIVECPPH